MSQLLSSYVPHLMKGIKTTKDFFNIKSTLSGKLW
nr:MAG TPA: hypothetical protein [Caudoviricetes sp.]